MTKYEIIFESIQDKVNSGELTMEDAKVLNDVAFEKYGDDETEYEEVTESFEEEGVTYEEYLESMEEELFGEATRYAKEIHKRPILSDYDSLGTGRAIAKMTDKEMDELFDDDERGRVFKKKIDKDYKQELIDNSPNHNLKQALGTLPGPYRQKHMARELMGVQRGKTTSQQKEDIKEKYKNYNGRDFTNRKGPYNFYGTDLKLDDMKKVIKRDLQKKDLSFEKRKKLRNFNN